MSDIAHSYDNNTPGGDLALDNGLLATDSGLETAVLHSLFSDARAMDEDPITDGNRRGWFGDLLAPDEKDSYGSRLWLLHQEKQTPEVLLRAKEYAEEALAWFITDGIAESVEVETSYPARGLLHLKVRITLTSGAMETFSFDKSLEG